MQRPKGDVREPIILDVDEYEKLLAACTGRPMLALYVLVLGETGVRCNSEALWLRWEDVDLERGLPDRRERAKGRTDEEREVAPGPDDSAASGSDAGALRRVRLRGLSREAVVRSARPGSSTTT